MRDFRNTMYVVATLCGLFAGYLSLQVDIDFEKNSGGGASISLDSAKDGGAVGFAILSGLALIAVAITFLKDEKTPYKYKSRRKNELSFFLRI